MADTVKNPETIAHTPAPWHVTPVFIAQGQHLHDALHFGDYRLNLWAITGRSTPPNTNPTISREEAQANARIFSAAPELLEALKAAHELLDSGTECAEEEPLVTIARCREAIDKAEGRA